MTFNHARSLGGALVFALALSLAGHAQGQAGGQPAPAAKAPSAAGATAQQGGLSSQDRHFIRKAMEANASEVAAGKLAAEKATNEDIKKFGERMAQDHSKAGEELKQIASELGVKLPANPAGKKKDKDEMKMLQRLKDEHFDAAYAKAQLMGHQKAVAMFRQEAQKGSAPQLKEFAEKTLPTLEEHLKLAMNLPYAKEMAEKKAQKKAGSKSK